MSILKSAAVAVTALMGLMNLGAVTGDAGTATVAAGLVLAALAVAAIGGFLASTSWGRPAVVAVGVLNVATALVGAALDVEGWPIALAVGALGAVLAAAYQPRRAALA